MSQSFRGVHRFRDTLKAQELLQPKREMLLEEVTLHKIESHLTKSMKLGIKLNLKFQVRQAQDPATYSRSTRRKLVCAGKTLE